MFESEINNENNEINNEINSNNNIIFNSSLHSYLGNDLNYIHERIFLEENNYITLPILYLDSVIIFPTESIPLRISNNTLVSYLRTHSISSNLSNNNSSNNNNNSNNNNENNPIILGIIGRYFNSEYNRVTIPNIGTIVEAIASKFEGNDAVLLAKGRCRFKQLSRFTDPVYHIQKVNALILSEGVCSYSTSASQLHNSLYHARAMNPFPFWVNFFTSFYLLNYLIHCFCFVLLYIFCM